MDVPRALSIRITMICAFVCSGVGLASGILVALQMIGELTSGPSASWINYLLIQQTVWLVPIGFYIALVALILFMSRRSVIWSMVWSTVLFAVSLGIIFRNSHNVPLWITTLASIISLITLNLSFEGGLKVLLSKLINDIISLRKRQTAIWKIVALMFAAAFIVNFIHNEIIKQTSEEARDARLIEWYNEARNKTKATDVIELKIFTDYQCPACSQLVPKYMDTALALGNNIAHVELRDYPLDAACNDSSLFSLHPAACAAAYAVRLVDKEMPDESHSFRSWLYENQTELDNDGILHRLNELRINNPQSMLDNEIKQAVRADLQEAKSYGIGAVPSVVLNNVLLPAGITPSRLELLLKSEITNK